MRADSVSTVSSSSTGTARLEHDRPGIQIGVDEVDGGARHTDAVFERLALRVESGKGRQQRRMDVEDSIRKGVEKRTADEAHEASQANEVEIAAARRSATARSYASRLA